MAWGLGPVCEWLRVGGPEDRAGGGVVDAIPTEEADLDFNLFFLQLEVTLGHPARPNAEGVPAALVEGRSATSWEAVMQAVPERDSLVTVRVAVRVLEAWIAARYE